MYSKQQVVNANIKLHTTLANEYKGTEPHYRPENIERVKNILINLQQQTNGSKLLDIGCGMGFIIDIAKDYFDYINGVDITPAMINKVNTEHNNCKISLDLADTASLPFEDNTFDVCTAHALLHHLDEITPTLKEVFRVLKPGGIFYSDLDPNYYFWKYINDLPENINYNEVITREIQAVKYKDLEFAKEFNIEKDLLYSAEHLKHVQGGFKEEDIIDTCNNIGFNSTSIRYEWFLGEGKYLHDPLTSNSIDTLRLYLKEILPLSRHLYKYISFYTEK